MLTAAGSSLVTGAAPAAPKTVRVRALRPFLIKGQRVEVGSEIELERRLATEIVTANKAELVTPAALVMAAAIADLKPDLQPKATLSKAPPARVDQQGIKP